jgi:hypothetical protein
MFLPYFAQIWIPLPVGATSYDTPPQQQRSGPSQQ